jgi:hypothetical protein
MPKSKRNGREISPHTTRHKVDTRSFENVAKTKLAIDILTERIQHPALAVAQVGIQRSAGLPQVGMPSPKALF